ncbi:hypothetical protein D3C79_599000 [compost metagenome]
MARQPVTLMPQLAHGPVQQRGNVAGVVAFGGRVGQAGARQVDGDGLVTLAGQGFHHMPPGVPGLRPARDQQHRLATAQLYAVQAAARLEDQVAMFEVGFGGC